MLLITAPQEAVCDTPATLSFNVHTGSVTTAVCAGCMTPHSSLACHHAAVIPKVLGQVPVRPCHIDKRC